MDFKHFFEAMDIFGFDNVPIVDKYKDVSTDPIQQFNIELMMEMLLNKNLDIYAPQSTFGNEIIWGDSRPGAMKIEIDTGYTFFIKRLNYDLEGNKCWGVKKVFQLDRRGMKGYEDIVANEVYDYAKKLYNKPVDAPAKEYKDLEKLVFEVTKKIRQSAPPIFIYRDIRKMPNEVYQIVFEMRGGGMGGYNQSKIENNVTQLYFDKETGTIKINNYNIKSNDGGRWLVSPDDLKISFFPTQDMKEISEAIAVHFKYY